MKPIDYDRLASTYDDLPIRHAIAIEQLLPAQPETEAVRVLDVGCGTGLYLGAQMEHFAGRNVDWFGIDPSAAMLAKARARAPLARVAVASAEALPFEASCFDLVVCRFAFHHVDDKERALDEFVRVLRRRGRLRIENIAPEAMPRWWIFAAFPESIAFNTRYPTAAWLEHALRDRGLDVRSNLVVQDGSMPIGEAVRQSRRRDQSHLASLDDDAYARGLERLERALAADADGLLPTQSALLEVVASAAPTR